MSWMGPDGITSKISCVTVYFSKVVAGWRYLFNLHFDEFYYVTSTVVPISFCVNYYIITLIYNNGKVASR